MQDLTKSQKLFLVNINSLYLHNIKHKKRRTNSCESILRLRDPGRIRTPNPQSRNLIFYPVELLGLCKCECTNFHNNSPIVNLDAFLQSQL